jgi:sulfur carrier protein
MTGRVRMNAAGNGVPPELTTVWINGEPRRVPPNQSVSALLHWLNIPADRVAVELNKSIVRSRDWEKTTISDGSEIEIVEFVGGG